VKCDVLGKLGSGQPVSTLERTRETANRPDTQGKFRWYKVRVGNQEGWVWGGYLNTGGVPPEKREWRRSPSTTPAEAKAKGRTILPKEKITSMLTAYRERMRQARERWRAWLSGKPAPSPTAQPTAPSPKPTVPTTRPGPLPSKPTTVAGPSQPPTKPTQAPTSGAPCLNQCLDLSKFTPQSQGDPRWAGNKIGTSENRTIKQVGCCLTSWSMLLQLYGKDLPPDKLNAALQQKGAFSGANLNQSRVGDLVGMRVQDTRDLSKGWQWNQNRALEEVKKNFSTKPPKPMLLQVDYNSDGDRDGNHFVVVTGMGPGGDPIIYDPGDRNNRGVPLSKVASHGGYVPLRVLTLDQPPP
jgi:hypothetical protein